MRNGQNKRMRGRNRQKHHSHNNSSHHQNPFTRVYESNGPEVKIRGTASHLAEKYIQLARDAHSSGDPVAAENYYQHAEHYFRLLAAANEQFRQQNPNFNNGNNPQQGPVGNDSRDEQFTDEDDGEDGGDQQPQFAPGDPQPYPQRDAQSQPNEQQNYNQRPQQNNQGQPNQNYGNRDYNNRGQNNQGHNQQNYGQQNAPQVGDSGGVGGLPSFITGGQPQQGQNPQPQNFPQGQGEQGGYENNNGNNGGGNFQGGDRYGGFRRRRRHRGPRTDGQPNVGQDGGEDSQG